MKFQILNLKSQMCVAVFALCTLLFAAAPGAAQDTPLTNKFPADLNSADSLGRTADGPTATLTSTINSSVTTFAVTGAASSFPASGLSLLIQNEIILCTTRTSATFSGCTRGAKGTTAASHTAGVAVRSPILSAQRDVLVAGLRTLEAKLGTGSSTPAANKVLLGTGSGTSGWADIPGVTTFHARSGPVTLQGSDLNGVDGSGLVNVSAAGGSGGVDNPGGTVIGSDNDSSGAEVISFRTQGVQRAFINAYGLFGANSADGLVNARQYGAVCNGDPGNATLDTQGLQLAIDSVGNTAVLRPLDVIVPGICRINATLLADKKGLSFGGRGWGNASTNQGTALVWDGAAGIPMLQVTQGYGTRIHNLRFIGNSAARPSAGINLLESGAGNVTLQTTIENVCIGACLGGYDTTGGTGGKASGQFVNGLLLDGANTNNGPNMIRNLHVFGTEVAVNVSDTQYSDNHFDSMYLDNNVIAFRTAAAGQMGSNWTTVSNDVDIALVENNAQLRVTQVTSEGSGRLLSITNGKTARFFCNGCSFQASANLNADGFFIDTGGFSNVYISVVLNNFTMDDVGGHGAVVPKIRIRGNATQMLHITDNIGVTPANLDVTPDSGNDQDAVREVVISGNNPSTGAAYFSRQILSYPDTLDITRWDTQKDLRVKGKLGINTIPGSSDASVNIAGGGLAVKKIGTPTTFLQTVGTAGSTTYTYYLVAVDRAGNKSTPYGPFTITTGNATLNGSNYVQLFVTPAQNGVDHYDVLKTNTSTYLGAITPGPSYGNARIDDQGQSTSGYSAPTRNATADTTLEGQLTVQGDILFSPDATHTIGLGSNRPQSIFVNNEVNGYNIVANRGHCYGGTTICDFAGAGSPEGVITASIGSTYRNTTNGDVYRKTSGAGNTGWVTP